MTKFTTLLIAFLFNASFVFSTTYYVATNGNDNNSGTSESAPFATLQHANDMVKGGDVVYIRGGHYNFSNDDLIYTNNIGVTVNRDHALYASPINLSTSGKQGAIIEYRNYPEETPVFDFENITAQKRITGILVTGSYIILKGIEIIHCPVNLAINHTQSECVRNLGSNNKYEQLVMHDSAAIGFYLTRGSDNLVLNCDAYNLCDTISGDGSGENSDGFGCHPTEGGTGNVIRGCRAWFCADDGFDCINAFEAVTFEGCWAFYNGYSTDFKSKANGNGIKGGGYGRTPKRVPRIIPVHVIKYCLAVGNKANGFYANHHPGGTEWYNNTAYNNRINYNMLGAKINGQRGSYSITDCDGFDIHIFNNISHYSANAVFQIHSSGTPIENLNYEKSEMGSNTFFMKNIVVSDKDFQSLDLSQLTNKRDANGNLPAIKCLHLVPSSDLKGAGIATEEGGTGSDLGCFTK